MIEPLTIDWLARNQNYRCYFCKEPFGSQKIDPHHCLIHDTKANRERYPHFIDSVINVKLAHRSCHDKRGNEDKITPEHAELIENMLAALYELLLQYGLDRQELMGAYDAINYKISRM